MSAEIELRGNQVQGNMSVDNQEQIDLFIPVIATNAFWEFSMSSHPLSS